MPSYSDKFNLMREQSVFLAKKKWGEFAAMFAQDCSVTAKALDVFLWGTRRSVSGYVRHESRRIVSRIVKKLRDGAMLKRVGSNKTGYWEVSP